MSEHLQVLIDAARSRSISDDDRQAQRRSFAYVNTKIENDGITREMVDKQDKILKTEALSRNHSALYLQSLICHNRAVPG